jgi:TRAP-type C4-dicarboxylate transport system permease small subunit
MLERLITGLSRILSWFAAAGIFTLMALVFISVFFRYILNDPINATEDLMALLLGMTIFTAYPAVTLNRGHIKVDLLTAPFKRFPRVNRIRLIIVDLGVVLMSSFIAMRIWDQAVRYEDRETLSNTMEWPLYPFVFCFAFLLFIATALFALRACKDRGQASEKSEDLSL